MQLKNTSPHRPKGMIIDIAEEDAKAIMKTGEFIESVKENLIIEKKEELPNESWLEKDIDKWVEKRNMLMDSFILLFWDHYYF